MLRRTFRDAQIVVHSIEPIAAGSTFDGIPVCNSLMYCAVSPANRRPKKIALALAMMAYTACWARVRRLSGLELPLPRSWREPVRTLAEAEMQVCVGGGYLRAHRDLTSTFILLLLLHQIWFAKALGKPVYLCAQSFGPFPRRIQRKFASAGLRRADLILAREAVSYRYLSSLGLDPERIAMVPDSAFTFQPDPWPGAHDLLVSRGPEEELVGITVRAWLPRAGQAAYERAVAEFIDRVSRRPALRVVVVAQVTATDQGDDDRVVGQRISDMLGRRDNVLFLSERLTHYQIKSVFDQLTYLVGTRFHSVIFGLTSRVPALAIEYEHKTSGIMQDLGLEHWVVRIQDVTADILTQMFDDLVSQRSSYARHLRKVMPDYIAEADKAGALIKMSYERSHQLAKQPLSGIPT
jgi:colanic acid/amylovoran biosynthesis protein